MKFEELNELGRRREPFLFISDFLAQNIQIIPLNKLSHADIEFCIDENYTCRKHGEVFKKYPQSFEIYKKKFDEVIEQIKSGNSYLLNLTATTPIATDLNLKEIYKLTNAHYKLRYKDKFVCFSPEKFVQIKDDKIHTYPMKGTIDSSIKDATYKILHDEKEMAEHVMVVDLLRNDLSMVASHVRVEDFRYVKSIDSGEKTLLHVSSHVSGYVSHEWHSKIGDILSLLLPAGSISGTPKKSTVEIIQKIENYDRDFFSGVFGVYDGKSFDSGVMIRFVDKTKDGLVYKSGGGITLDSDAKSEYNELLDKIYLP